jgi:hypothetical protein
MIKTMVAASLALNAVAQTCYTASDQFFGSTIGNRYSDEDILYGTAQTRLTKYHTLSQVNYCT